MALAEAGWPRVSYHFISIGSQDDVGKADGTWQRHRARLSVPFFGERLIPQVRFRKSWRALRDGDSDSLSASSSAYVQLIPGVAWRTPFGEVGSSVDVRNEEQVVAGAFKPSSQAITWDTHFDLKLSGSFRMDGRVGIRRRTFNEVSDAMPAPSSQRSAVLRWSGRLQPRNRALQWHWSYEVMSERTPSLQEFYIRTGPELGEYVWVDENGNGVIELDEFLPETTQDEGTYVRTLIPSDSLQSVTGLQARFSLDMDPARIWRNTRIRWKRALRRIAMRTAVSVQEKSRNPTLFDVYLLRLGTFRSPVHTLKGLMVVQQDVFLFRDMPQYGADFSYRHVRGLNELAAGAESHATDEYRGTARVKVADRWHLAVALSSGTRRAASEAFGSRNYSIRTRALAPEVTYSPVPRLQVALTTSAARKTSASARASLWKVPVDVRYVRATRFSVTGRIEAASVVIQGEANTRGLAFFELTDGRGAGTSFMWTASAWYQLSSVLRSTLAYNGRRPQGVRAIHTVRIQLSAVF